MYQGKFYQQSLFSRMHAILQPALSVCLSVGQSVRRSHLAFLEVMGCFGVTAPAQQLGWSISLLPLPARTRLVSRYGLVTVTAKNGGIVSYEIGTNSQQK